LLCAAAEFSQHGRGDVNGRDPRTGFDELQVQPRACSNDQDSFAGLNVGQFE
jgi:hypothetical protein